MENYKNKHFACNGCKLSYKSYMGLWKHNKKYHTTCEEITKNNNNEKEEEKKIFKQDLNYIEKSHTKVEKHNNNESNIKYTILKINEPNILVRSCDYFIDATFICNQFNKNFDDWFKMYKTSELMIELLKIKQKELSKLVFSDDTFTWICHELAYQLALWLSPVFALKLGMWISNYQCNNLIKNF